MMILLVGGPYDGRRIWASDLLQHTIVLAIASLAATQRFLYLPDPADWQAVLDGQMKVDDSREYHYYELVSTPGGLLLRFDEDRESFREAIGRAVQDMPDRDGQLGA